MPFSDKVYIALSTVFNYFSIFVELKIFSSLPMNFQQEIHLYLLDCQTLNDFGPILGFKLFLNHSWIIFIPHQTSYFDKNWVTKKINRNASILAIFSILALKKCIKNSKKQKKKLVCIYFKPNHMVNDSIIWRGKKLKI